MTKNDSYLYVGTAEKPMTLNPVLSSDDFTNKFLNLIWDTTAVRDPDDYSIRPWIATDWKMTSPDYRNFTVHYRLGKYDPENEINFHDGHHVDIYDFLFSFEYAMKEKKWSRQFAALDKTPNGTVFPPEGSNSSAIHCIRGISMETNNDLRDHTLNFRLNKTDSIWEADFLLIPICPYHLWKDRLYSGDHNTKSDDDVNLEPDTNMMGSGAFLYRGQTITLNQTQLGANKKYFKWNQMPRDRDAKPPPALVGTEWYWSVKKSPLTVDVHQQAWSTRPTVPQIDGVILIYYADIYNAILSLQAGDIDAIWWSVSPRNLKAMYFMDYPDIQVVSTENVTLYYTGFNMRYPCFGGDNQDSSGRILRKAISMCTLKNETVMRILGQGTVVSSLISPNDKEWYNQTVIPHEFDETGAKKILIENGFKYENYHFSDIPKIQIVHQVYDYDGVHYNPVWRLGEILREIGVDATISGTYLPPNELLENPPMVWALALNFGRDPFKLYNYFHSSQAGYNQTNFCGFSNATFDKTIEAALSEMNHSKQVQLIKDAQGIISENLPFDVWYYKPLEEAYAKARWAGWLRTPEGIMNRWSFCFIHKPLVLLKISVDMPTNMPSDTTTTIRVMVLNKTSGTPVENTNISLHVYSEYEFCTGKFTLSGNPWAYTDTNKSGIASFEYQSPQPYKNKITNNLTLHVIASLDDEDISDAYYDFTVYTSAGRTQNNNQLILVGVGISLAAIVSIVLFVKWRKKRH